MKIKSLLTAIVVAGTLMYFPANSIAQGLPDDPGVDPDTEVPFDGGLSLLIGAGIAYGAKKAYDKRKKEKDPSVDETKTVE